MCEGLLIGSLPWSSGPAGVDGDGSREGGLRTQWVPKTNLLRPTPPEPGHGIEAGTVQTIRSGPRPAGKRGGRCSPTGCAGPVRTGALAGRGATASHVGGEHTGPTAGWAPRTREGRTRLLRPACSGRRDSNSRPVSLSRRPGTGNVVVRRSAPPTELRPVMGEGGISRTRWPAGDRDDKAVTQPLRPARDRACCAQVVVVEDAGSRTRTPRSQGDNPRPPAPVGQGVVKDCRAHRELRPP